MQSGKRDGIQAKRKRKGPDGCKCHERLWHMGGYFPPGYEYEKERNGAALLLGLAVLYSFSFFWRLYDAWDRLYYINRSEGRMLRPGITAEPFWSLAAEYPGYLAGFFLYFLFLAVMAVQHYLYFFRDAKSIYLMRRLPEKGALCKSCVQAPVFGLVIGIIMMVVLYSAYYGIYMLVMPADCMPAFL